MDKKILLRPLPSSDDTRGPREGYCAPSFGAKHCAAYSAYETVLRVRNSAQDTKQWAEYETVGATENSTGDMKEGTQDRNNAHHTKLFTKIPHSCIAQPPHRTVTD